MKTFFAPYFSSNFLTGSCKFRLKCDAGLKPRAADRTHRDPLVMIGGAVTFVNPEPLPAEGG